MIVPTRQLSSNPSSDACRPAATNAPSSHMKGVSVFFRSDAARSVPNCPRKARVSFQRLRPIPPHPKTGAPSLLHWAPAAGAPRPCRRRTSSRRGLFPATTGERPAPVPLPFQRIALAPACPRHKGCAHPRRLPSTRGLAPPHHAARASARPTHGLGERAGERPPSDDVVAQIGQAEDTGIAGKATGQLHILDGESGLHRFEPHIIHRHCFPFSQAGFQGSAPVSAVQKSA